MTVPAGLNKILVFTGGAVAGIIIIVLIVFLVKDVISFMRGQGVSIFAILGKVAAIFVILAIVILSSQFMTKGQALSETVGGVADNLITDLQGVK